MTTLLDWAAQTLGFREKDERIIQVDGRNIPYVEINTTDQVNQPLIIGIHGFGTNERQMQTLVNIAPKVPHTYIAPRPLAPHPTGGFMWFDINFDGKTAIF